MEAAPTALVCTGLRLRQFRNFPALELEFPGAGAAVIGDNGSGKTNLLESLHYLEIFRSFRGAADEQLVRFGAEAFHVRGRFTDSESGRESEITAAYEPRTRRKRVTIDGAEVERLGDAIGHLGSVIFSPSDVSIVAGAPGERRRFLDIVLSLNVRGYIDALQRYRQVLKQRNALLREGVQGVQLEPWNAALVENGARIMAGRQSWIAAHADRFAALYAAIAGGSGASMAYNADVPAHDEEEAATSHESLVRAFATRLERVAHRERERGVTLAGPHRDDVALLMHTADGQVDLREFGSGGQVRTGAIALRMVEAETVWQARGVRPLLLLDDVFAELDAARSERILELLRDGQHGQVILTAPKEADLRLDSAGEALLGPLPRWRIAQGRIS